MIDIQIEAAQESGSKQAEPINYRLNDKISKPTNNFKQTIYRADTLPARQECIQMISAEIRRITH